VQEGQFHSAAAGALVRNAVLRLRTAAPVKRRRSGSAFVTAAIFLAGRAAFQRRHCNAPSTADPHPMCASFAIPWAACKKRANHSFITNY
jgi:hypothetical protein